MVFFSDTYDRRRVIVITTFLSALFAFLAIIFGGNAIENMYLSIQISFSKIFFFIVVGLYAGLCLPLFSLNLAHTNDFVPKEKFVAAGGGLQLVFGIGAVSYTHLTLPTICSV